MHKLAESSGIAFSDFSDVAQHGFNLLALFVGHLIPAVGQFGPYDFVDR
jgi:hypothetical protein